AMTMTARKKRGTTLTSSVSRMSTSSRIAPRQPDSAPIVIPTKEARAVTVSATSRDVRAPWTTPAKRSRPRSSVPIGCAIAGGGRGGGTDANGSTGAIRPARRATARSAPVKPKPRPPDNLLQTRHALVFAPADEAMLTRPGLLVADAGIEPPIHEVGEE